MTIAKVSTVVSTKWLRDQLGNGAKNVAARNLRVLDTSFEKDSSIDTYRTGYLPNHIPQSLFFCIHKCVESTPEIPRNLPDPKCFEKYASSLGIFPDTHVVAYDRYGPKSAFRTWWTFRLFGHKNVSVLDGGYNKWVADGYEVTDQEPVVIPRSRFVVNLDKSLLRNYEEMVENATSQREQVVDARGDQESSVTNEETGGVLPGAKHVDYDHLFNEDGTIKSEEEVKALFDEAGVDMTQPMVASCLSGMTACAVAGAAHVLGNDIPVYYGSWTEWRQRAPDDMKHRVVPRG